MDHSSGRASSAFMSRKRGLRPPHAEPAVEPFRPMSNVRSASHRFDGRGELRRRSKDLAAVAKQFRDDRRVLPFRFTEVRKSARQHTAHRALALSREDVAFRSVHRDLSADVEADAIPRHP